jgi:flavin-dependent dehydrogenase
LLFDALRRDHPRLRDLLKDATPVGPVKGYPLRVDFPQCTVMVEGAIGVGEAIGLVNPFTGEGIDYSLESGRIAAEAILAASDFTMRGLRDYPRWLNARFRDYFVLITRLKDVLYNTFMLNRIIGRGATSSYIRDTMMHICFGLTSPRQVFSPKMLWEVLRP